MSAIIIIILSIIFVALCAVCLIILGIPCLVAWFVDTFEEGSHGAIAGLMTLFIIIAAIVFIITSL